MYQVIQKIDKDYYINLKTGEINAFEHNETRADDFRSIAKTMKLGRDIINTNIPDPTKAKFITLTYVENMTDEKKLKRDTEFFIRKINRRYENIKYITAVEPQERGAWHFHMILIFPNKSPFIANSLIGKLWGHGFTYTTKIDEVDNVGAYLTSYLTDIPLYDLDGNMVEDIPPGTEIKIHKDKKYIKGARLKYYPKGMRIFRYSKGILRPTVDHMLYKDIKKEIGSAKPTYSNTVEVENDTFKSIVHKEYYNSLNSGYHNYKKK